MLKQLKNFTKSANIIIKHKHSYFQNFIQNNKINATKSIFYVQSIKSFSRRDDVFFDSEIKAQLNKKFNIPSPLKVIQNDKDAIKRYNEFIQEREERKLNFNRKNRWEQRELDDIIKNFDLKTSKFKDLSHIENQMGILNKKKFNSTEEILYFVEDLLKHNEFLSEDVISNALDVFIKDFDKLDSKILESPVLVEFTSQVIYWLTAFKEINLVKAAKFFDWYNVSNRNAWFNLEGVIENMVNGIYREKSSLTGSSKGSFASGLIIILSHFANQKEGSGEFYDLFQYFFWSSKFSDVSLPELISLGYSLFITDQGYDIFYYDLSIEINKKLDNETIKKIDIIDLIRIIQIYSSISKSYEWLYIKLEEIVLKRMNLLTINEASMLACGFSIAFYGTPLLFKSLENIVISEINLLDEYSFRDVVRGFIISQIGSDKLFLLIMSEFINNSNYNLENKNLAVVNSKVNKFSITELVYVMKSFSDRIRDSDNYKQLGIKYSSVEKLFTIFEEMLVERIIKNKEGLLLEEICSVCHYYCEIKIISRDTQKIMEQIISERINDIKKQQNILKFLYSIFTESKMCSTGLMDLLYSNRI